MTHLIGICGHAGAGKDTAAEWLCEVYNYTPLAFADPLKEACAAAFGIDLKHFYDSKLKEEPDPFWQVSPREIAQFVGTQMFRYLPSKLIPEIKTNFWVSRLQKEIAAHNYERVVISDVRFQNEVDFIQNNGGHILFITRPGKYGNVGILKDGQLHESEQLSSLSCNPETLHLINNSQDLSYLYNNLAKFMKYISK